MSRFALSTRAVTGCSFDKSIIGQQWNAHDIDQWLDHVFADDDPACDDMPEVQAWAVDVDQDGWALCGSPKCSEMCHAEKHLFQGHAHCGLVCREESIVADEIYADSQVVQELVLSIVEDASYTPETVDERDKTEYPVDDKTFDLFDGVPPLRYDAAELSNE